MNRTRTRALLAAAALGVATIALPIASAAASDYQTCDDVPGMTKIDSAAGSHNGAWGTIAWGGNDLDHDLLDGWTLHVCLKAGNNVQVTGPHTGAGTVNTPTQNEISHIGYILDFEEPSDDDGDTDDDGLDDDGTDDDGDTDDGVGEDDGTDDDGTDDGVGSDDDGTDDDGTDDDGTDDDGTDEDGTDDDGTDVLPGGEVAPVDGDDDGEATDDDGTVTEVPVEVLPAALDNRLPNTGSDVPALLAAAALALGLGGTALVRTRRGTTSA